MHAHYTADDEREGHLEAQLHCLLRGKVCRHAIQADESLSVNDLLFGGDCTRKRRTLFAEERQVSYVQTLSAVNMAPKPWLTITKNKSPRRLKTVLCPRPIRRYIRPMRTPSTMFCTNLAAISEREENKQTNKKLKYRRPYVMRSRKALRAARVHRMANWLNQLANRFLFERST